MQRLGLRGYLTWFVWTFWPPAGSGAPPRGWGKFRVAALLAIVLPLAILHRIALALDDCFDSGWRKVEPRRPLFVIGIPRSGTTFLHRLLASDRRRFSTMPLWELLLAPAVCQKRLLRGWAVVDRCLGSPGLRLVGWLERRVAGSWDAVHATSLWQPEEDFLSLLPLAACFLVIHAFPFADIWKLARFDRELTEAQRRRLADYYRGVVQRHLYFRGAERIYLSKNPTYSGATRWLRAAFPDCRLAICVREPIAACGSLLSTMDAGARMFGRPARDVWLRDGLVELLGDYYRFLADTRDEMPLERRVVIDYAALIADPQSEVERLWTALGYGTSIEGAEGLAAAAAAGRRYRSSHGYALHDFGLDAATVQNKLAAAGRLVPAAEPAPHPARSGGERPRPARWK